MKTRDYIYNPCENTITITKAFAEALQNPTSDEYKIFHAIKADNPAITIRMRTHKTKAGYKNQFNKLTYENMEDYISLIPNSTELLKAYNTLKACANLFRKSPYKAVRDWFVAQFPKYIEDPMFHLAGVQNIVSIDRYLEEPKEAEKKGA